MTQNHIGSRLSGLGESISEFEWAFYSLSSPEIEACLRYECFRERAFFQCEALHQEAALLKKQAGGITDHVFPQLLEIQEELNYLGRKCHPWLSLTRKERAALLNSVEMPEKSVWVVSELTPLQKLIAKHSKKRKRLELVVDWSESPKQLKECFGNTLEWLRKHDRQVPNRTEKRGAKKSECSALLYLTLWRLEKAGIPRVRIIEMIDSHRINSSDLGIPDSGTLKKNFRKYVREAEAAILA